MPTKKSKPRRGWVFSPPKPSKPKIDDTTKAEVEGKADELIQSFLKPEFVKPPPEGTEWNHIVDIFGKWYRSYFYLCAKYRCPAPNCISEFFETKFARLEYVGSGKFLVLTVFVFASKNDYLQHSALPISPMLEK